ncbi:MAG: hypothetical protein JSV52_12700 [Candidatus Zixiibacteriota bacterium]|nr:MAG: hypothetical protein JSV52_12700 [candidate division Zixibacteria bacterium]
MTEKLRLKGALHMHTSLSHDGELSLTELAFYLKSKGYDYIALSEHSYDIKNDSMKQLVAEAESLSSEDFIIIPGIEFRCRGWTDILGYGVVDTCDSEDPITIIDHIHNHGGVAVLAHPNVREIPIDKSWVAMLDGCEIWNVSNEGKYLPQSGSIRKFRELAADNTALLAFTGLDLHRTDSYCDLSTETYVERRRPADILRALQKGHFRSVSPLLSMDSRGTISAVSQFRIGIMRSLLNGVRGVRNLVRR